MTQFVYLDCGFFTLYAFSIMNPHPIPQNVTNFQFRLVGDMTLKQFLYLAGGSAIAYLLFVFLTPIYPVVAWPLLILSASLGAAFAFLPVDSRPLDHWLAAFLKAIYSPTKRIWKRNGKTFNEDPLFNSRMSLYLASLQPGVTNQNAAPVIAAQPAVKSVIRQISKPAADLPSTEDLGKTVDLARQAQNLQLKILQTERTLNQIKTEAQKPTAIPVDYSQQVNKILSDLQILVNQASQIRAQLQTVIKPEPAPLGQGFAGQVKRVEKVKIVIPAKSKQTQLALTTFPNVINGIIKDTSGNYLEGCIAVIHDKEGLPVRALKTNKLGQFTGSTPLPNGTYKLTLEKEGLIFDVLQMELSGGVLPPLMIISK